MISNSPRFPDVQNHWASRFIEELATRRILNGYPNGTFRPDNSVTRAEFAAILGAVFTVYPKREYVPFVDVPANHWAISAIKKTYEMGFLIGYPDGRFRPNERIFRCDVLVALVNGLEIAAPVKPDLLNMRSWTLYREMGDYWIIQRILSAGTTFATVAQPGNYAVAAVDRLGNESRGVVITVI